MFSVGFPTGASAVTTSSDPTNLLPFPSMGRPNGHRETPLLIYDFLRVAHAVLICKRFLYIPKSPCCNFLRIAAPWWQCKPQACGNWRLLWKSRDFRLFLPDHRASELAFFTSVKISRRGREPVVSWRCRQESLSSCRAPSAEDEILHTFDSIGLQAAPTGQTGVRHKSRHEILSALHL
jgi:hypothetical protein